MTPDECLRTAYNLLRSRDLIKGPLAVGRVKPGQKKVGEVLPWQENAEVTGLSICGALCMAAGKWPDEEPVCSALARVSDVLVDRYLSVEVFSDAPNVTKEDALALLKGLTDQ